MDTDATALFVGQVSKSVSSSQLESHLRQLTRCRITFCSVQQTETNGMHAGCAKVRFVSREDRDAAAVAIDDALFQGARLRAHPWTGRSRLQRRTARQQELDKIQAQHAQETSVLQADLDSTKRRLRASEAEVSALKQQLQHEQQLQQNQQQLLAQLKPPGLPASAAQPAATAKLLKSVNAAPVLAAPSASAKPAGACSVRSGPEALADEEITYSDRITCKLSGVNNEQGLTDVRLMIFKSATSSRLHVSHHKAGSLDTTVFLSERPTSYFSYDRAVIFPATRKDGSVGIYLMSADAGYKAMWQAVQGALSKYEEVRAQEKDKNLPAAMLKDMAMRNAQACVYVDRPPPMIAATPGFSPFAVPANDEHLKRYKPYVEAVDWYDSMTKAAKARVVKKAALERKAAERAQSAAAETARREAAERAQSAAAETARREAAEKKAEKERTETYKKAQEKLQAAMTAASAKLEEIQRKAREADRAPISCERCGAWLSREKGCAFCRAEARQSDFSIASAHGDAGLHECPAANPGCDSAWECDDAVNGTSPQRPKAKGGLEAESPEVPATAEQYSLAQGDTESEELDAELPAISLLAVASQPPDQWSSFRMRELRTECVKRLLQSSGRKRELLDRIRGYDAAKQAMAEEEKDADVEAGEEQTPGGVQRERRLDPTDGKARSYDELMRCCIEAYSAEDIRDFWESLEVCADEGKPAAAEADDEEPEVTESDAEDPAATEADEEESKADEGEGEDLAAAEAEANGDEPTAAEAEEKAAEEQHRELNTLAEIEQSEDVDGGDIDEDAQYECGDPEASSESGSEPWDNGEESNDEYIDSYSDSE